MSERGVSGWEAMLRGADTERRAPSDLAFSSRQRSLKEAVIQRLIGRIPTHGVPTPPIARFVGDTLEVIAGVHLVEACRRLGLPAIDVQIEYLTDAAARVYEISEAFTHADLSEAERAELVAEFKELDAATIYRDADPSERAQMLADLQAFPDRALISALRLIYAEVMGGAA